MNPAISLSWVPTGWILAAASAEGWHWWGWFTLIVIGSEARDRLRWLLGLLGILWGVRGLWSLWRLFMTQPFRQMLHRGDSRLFEFHSGYTSILLGFALGWGEQSPKVEELLALVMPLLVWKALMILAGACQVALARTPHRQWRAGCAVVMLGQWGGLLALYLLAALGYGEVSLMFPAIFSPLLITTWLTIFMLRRREWGGHGTGGSVA